jgi:hypothetical protein
MQGLLYVLNDPPSGEEAAFHDWYDSECIPAHLRVPGIVSARRYEAQGDKPGWLTMYEVTDLGALSSPEYRAACEPRSPREIDLRVRMPHHERRVYRLLSERVKDPAETPYLVTIGMTPGAGGEQDYNDWYEQEYTSLLHTLDGWQRSRRYELVEGSGPTFMAIHNLRDMEMFKTPDFARVLDTPWRKRVRDRLHKYDRCFFRLFRTFGTA